MIFKFTSVMIPGARIAQARVPLTLTAGEVGDVLRIGGLEIATPLAMGDRIGGCGIMPGDRVAVFSDEARAGDFPVPVRTGGREVIIHVGGREISTGGSPSLTMGVPDPSEMPPDVDLREAAASSRVNLLPARCAALLFDGQIGQWFIALAGGARVMLDDYELTQQPIPLSSAHTLRFFTPLDDPAVQQPLAEMTLTVGAASHEEVPRLPVGQHKLTVRFGRELGPYMLRASDNVRIGQVAAGLAKQADIDLTESAQVMRLRLAPPYTRISDLLPGEQLYTKS